MEVPGESEAPRDLGCETAEPHRVTLVPGMQLGPFKIVALLGAGGMGEVYNAFDPRLDRHVALKVLSERAVAAGFRSHFVHEARAAASLNHPNIAQVYEIGEASGTCYIAMEYVEGETLRQKLKASECTLPELLEYLRQTANAVTTAHAAGVVHCDLKPDNIMVTREGAAKVLDFGLATLIQQYRREDSTRESQSTAPTVTLIPEWNRGLVRGTVGYMSPEQAEAKHIDERSDIFSFGCILFEAATRHLPFSGESTVRTFHNLLYEPAPRINSLCRNAPPALQRIVDGCLEKDPAQRHLSMAEISRGLAELLREMEPGGAAAPAARPFGGLPVPVRGHRPSLLAGSLRKTVGAAAVLALAITVGAVAYLRWPARTATASIAVIPFVNARDTPESEYLSDGISEALINALAQMPGVKVIARSSSFKFKGKGTDIRTAARSLGVQVLVTGRVAEMDGRLRITAELVNGADGTQIWGAQYNTGTSGLPGLEAEICREIAGRVRSKLTQTEWAKLARATNVKPEAFELLLRGRYHLQLYTPESRQQAVAYYQQALALDPGFALANAELARSYRLLSGSAVLSPVEVLPKAEAAARRALAADNNLAEAHAALADIKKDQWDWSSAEIEYRKAVELNPNLASAHQGFSIYLSVTGKHEAAIEEIQRAIELDPLDLPTAIHAAAVYYNARRYDQALNALKRAIDLDPTAPTPWTWTGIVNGARGNFTTAIAAYEKAIGLGDDTPAAQCYYAYSLSRAGRRDQALEILSRLQGSDRYVPPTTLAILYAGLNQKERAIQLLQEAYTSRDTLLQYLRVEPHLDILSNDQRFLELAARIGLPT